MIQGEANEHGTPGDERGTSPVSGNGATPAGIGTGSGSGGEGALLILHSPKPEHPLSARRRRIEGVAVIEAVVGPDGDVTSAKLVESSGSDALKQSALGAVKQWKYQRRTGDDKVEPVVQRIRCVFKLED
jgi:TonB family protein